MQRDGFTLVELVASIVIISILAGMGLLGIQMIRESARRVQCSNKMRQVVFAYVSFEAAFGTAPYPLAGVWSGQTKGPMVDLLPYLELESVQRAMGETPSHHFEPPFPKSFPIFSCNSDGLPGLNYRGNIGTEPYTYDFGIGGGNGAFDLFGHVTFSSCTDGLSNTSAFSERKLGRGRMRVGEDIWVAGIYEKLNGFPTAEQLIPFFMESCPPGGNFEYAGHDWAAYGTTHSYYNHILGPNSRYCDLIVDSAVTSSIPNGGATAPSSFHPHGVNAAMMDGSLRFISNSISQNVWVSLGSRNGEDNVLSSN